MLKTWDLALAFTSNLASRLPRAIVFFFCLFFLLLLGLCKLRFLAGGLISVFCRNYRFHERIFCSLFQVCGKANCHFRDKRRVTFFTEEFSITYQTLILTRPHYSSAGTEFVCQVSKLLKLANKSKFFLSTKQMSVILWQTF